MKRYANIVENGLDFVLLPMDYNTLCDMHMNYYKLLYGCLLWKLPFRRHDFPLLSNSIFTRVDMINNAIMCFISINISYWRINNKNKNRNKQTKQRAKTTNKQTWTLKLFQKIAFFFFSFLFVLFFHTLYAQYLQLIMEYSLVVKKIWVTRLISLILTKNILMRYAPARKRQHPSTHPIDCYMKHCLETNSLKTILSTPHS